MQIQNIQDLKDLFASERKRVKILRDMAQKQGNTEADGLLRDAWLRLKQGPVRTLVLGVSSAGKSTLINALVGHIVVPEGKHTTSPVPVWVYCDEYADADPYSLAIREKNNRFVKEHCSQYGHIIDYCYTPTQAGQGMGQAQFANVITAAVNVDSGVVSEAGITLVDTPGIGVSLGDNARVQEILKDGCELLLIVFMNLQEQDVKDYFRSLLVEENAPLRSLLEDNKVFMVLNNIRSVSGHAREDAKRHIADAFNGWGCEERLFVVNAWDARLTRCGVYPYPALLPKGFTPAERQQANEAKAKDQARLLKAKTQPELEELIAALAEEVEIICEDPEEVARIWDPIHDRIQKAADMLKAPLLEKRRKAEEADYPVPGELRKKAMRLEQYAQELEKLRSEAEKLLECRSPDFPKRFPSDKLANKLLNDDALERYHLLANNFKEAEQLLLGRIESGDGPEYLTRKACYRVYKLREPMGRLLGMSSVNQEIEYSQKLILDLYRRLSTENVGGQLIAQEKLDVYFQNVNKAFSDAREAGVHAIDREVRFEVTEQEQAALKQYLEDKRRKIRAGGLRRGFNRFMLMINVEVDRLRPIVSRLIRESSGVYMAAYRESFGSRTGELHRHYCSLLTEAGITLGLLRNSVKEQIEQACAAAKAAALAEVDEELKKLEFGTICRKDTEHE